MKLAIFNLRKDQEVFPPGRQAIMTGLVTLACSTNLWNIGGGKYYFRIQLVKK
jgi:hypothetical protein